jgi:hypothetical protein
MAIRCRIGIVTDRSLGAGAGAARGALPGYPLVLDDVSGDDNAVLDGVGAGIGVDRAARLKCA